MSHDDRDEESCAVAKEPCPDCGSRDNLVRYSDGHGYCFGCQRYEHPEGGPSLADIQTKKPVSGLLSGIEYKAIPSRRLTEETCRFWGYGVADDNGRTVQVAQYRKDGSLVAQKARGKDKNFYTLGDFKNSGLYGQHLWQGSNAKHLVIVEGEIDALSMSQVQGNKWPVVSVPNGAAGAAKAVAKELAFVSQFPSVIIMFDMDDPGRMAAKEVAKILPPGTAKIALTPLKDASAMLIAGRSEELINAMWRAEEYRPDGLVGIDDILDDIQKPVEWGLPWFLPTLTTLTFGRRDGDIYAFGAGTGIGKTDLFTQQMEADIRDGHHIGVIALEQMPAETGKRLAGKAAGQRFHIPDAGWTQEQLTEAVEGLRGKVTFYDNFGQTDWSVVKGHIRFMVRGLGIKLIYLDHLTAMADTSDEKGSLEQIMKEMAGLAKELGCIIHFISHLSTPEGKPHEEGGRVTIRHFKGSRSIGFWSVFMFGMERDQQHEDRVLRSLTTFRILKDRYTGNSTGEVIYLGYDVDTGRLYETEKPSEEDDFDDETGDGDDF